MKRQILSCSALVVFALSYAEINGMARGQGVTFENSFDQARMYCNEILRLGGDPKETLGIYRWGLISPLLLPDFRETIESAFNKVNQLQMMQQAQGSSITINAGTGIQPVKGSYNNRPGNGPRSLQGQSNHFTCFQVDAANAPRCIPNAVLAHSGDDLGSEVVSFSANIDNKASARAIADLCGCQLNNIPDNFVLTIENAAAASNGQNVFLKPQWAFLRNYVNRYGANGARYIPNINATCRVRVVRSDGAIVDPWNGERRENYKLWRNGNKAVSTGFGDAGNLNIHDGASSRAIIYAVETQEVRNGNQVIYPAHTEVGVILLYNNNDVQRFSGVENGSNLEQLISSIPEVLRAPMNPVFEPVLQQLARLRREQRPIVEPGHENEFLTGQDLTVSNSFWQTLLRYRELERLGMNRNSIDEMFGIYRYGVISDLLLDPFRLSIATADDRIHGRGANNQRGVLPEPLAAPVNPNEQNVQPRPAARPLQVQPELPAIPENINVQNIPPLTKIVVSAEEMGRILVPYVRRSLIPAQEGRATLESVQKKIKEPKSLLVAGIGKPMALKFGIVRGDEGFKWDEFFDQKLGGLGQNERFGNDSKEHLLLDVLTFIDQCLRNPPQNLHAKARMKFLFQKWISALKEWCTADGWIRFKNISDQDLDKLERIAGQVRDHRGDLIPEADILELCGDRNTQLAAGKGIGGLPILIWMKNPNEIYRPGHLISSLTMFKDLSAAQKTQLAFPQADTERESFISSLLARVPQEKFDEDTKEHKFFSILNILSLSERFVPNPIKRALLHRWVEILQSWCTADGWMNSNNVSEEDIQKLEKAANVLSSNAFANVFDPNDLLVLKGMEGSVLPEGRGIGGNSILRWMKSHIKSELDQEMSNRRIQFVQSILDGVDANQFVSELPEQDLFALNMLTLKPVLLEPLFHHNGQNIREEELVKRFMPEIYDSLKDFPLLLKYFVASSFGETFNLNIFVRFVLAGLSNILPQVPGDQPSLQSIRAIIACILPDNENRQARLERLPEMTNINTQGISGNVVLPGSNIFLPQLYFPNLTLTQRVARDQAEMNRLTRFREVSANFDRTDENIYGDYIGIDGIDTAFWNMSVALRDAYRQDIQNGDVQYTQLGAVINARQNNLIRSYAQACEQEVGGDGNEIFEQRCESFLGMRQELMRISADLTGNITLVNSFTPEQSAVIDAVAKYNKFADALQKHIKGFVSREEADETMRIKGIKGSSLQNPLQAISDQFVPSEVFFNLWNVSFLQPQDGAGILTHVFDQNQELRDKIQFVQTIDVSDPLVRDISDEVPYLYVHSRLLSSVGAIDPRFAIALSQQMHFQSFINLCTFKPLFDKSIENMKDLLTSGTYSPKHDITAIKDYSVNPRNELYDASALGSLVNTWHILDRTPVQGQDMPIIDWDQGGSRGMYKELRRLYAYYSLKGIYVSLTGDVNLSKRYRTAGDVAQVIEGERGGWKFPSLGDFILDDNNPIENDILTPLINAARGQIRDGHIRDIPGLAGSGARFEDFLGLHGDAGDYAQRREWSRALDQFEEDFDRYQGIEYRMKKDVIGNVGLLCNPHMVKFIVGRLATELNIDHAALPSFYGNLSNRLGHCPNGRMEATTSTFALQFSGELIRRFSFDGLLKLSANLAAFNILNSVFDFSLRLPTARELQNANVRGQLFYGEAATAKGNAISGVGEKLGFGLPHGGEVGGNFNARESLRAYFAGQVIDKITHPNSWFEKQIKISKLCGELGENAQITVNDRQYSRERQIITVSLSDDERKFKKFFTSDNPDLLEDSQFLSYLNSRDARDRKILKRACAVGIETHRNTNNLKNMFASVAKVVLTPSAIIDWFFESEQGEILNVLLDKYVKMQEGNNSQVNVNTMKYDQKKKILFDALTDAGLFQRLGAQAH